MSSAQSSHPDGSEKSTAIVLANAHSTVPVRGAEIKRNENYEQWAMVETARRLNEKYADKSGPVKPGSSFDQRVEAALGSPVTFSQFAAQYLVNNRQDVIQKIKSGLHPETGNGMQIFNINTFLFDAILYPAIADKVKFPLEKPVDLNKKDKNQALRKLIDSTKIFIGDGMHGVKPLSYYYAYHGGYNCHFKLSNGDPVDATSYVKEYFLREISNHLLQNRSDISLKEFFDGISPIFLVPGQKESRANDSLKTLDEVLNSIGSSIFESLGKNKIMHEVYQDSEVDLGSDKNIDWYLTNMISLLSGVPVKKDIQEQSPEKQIFLPTFENFPGFRRQLEVHMVRLGITDKIFETVGEKEKPKHEALTPTIFFNDLDRHIFKGEVGKKLAAYAKAPSSTTVREAAFSLMKRLTNKNVVDPEQTPSKTTIKEVYFEMETILENVVGIYDIMFKLTQLYKIGEVYAASGIPQKVREGEFLMMRILVETERLEEMAVQIEAQASVPNFNFDEIRDTAVALGMLLEGDHLRQAFYQVQQLSSAMSDGAAGMKEATAAIEK